MMQDELKDMPNAKVMLKDTPVVWTGCACAKCYIDMLELQMLVLHLDRRISGWRTVSSLMHNSSHRL